MFVCQFCAAQAITVAAAADLQFAMQDIVAAKFQKETGKEVKLTYGSSGNFFQQIQNGAPFDMFFSANLDYPKKLEIRRINGVSGSYYEYARGKIVVWVPNDSGFDLSSGLQYLLNPFRQEDCRRKSTARPVWTSRRRCHAEGGYL
jgi:molybdate transport system substrate-binding protein